MLVHPIDTIIFDLDGTLRHNLPSADDVQYEFVLQYGVQNGHGRQRLGARWAHSYWAQSGEFFTDIEKFGEMEDGFWERYAYRYLLALELPEPEAADLAPRLHQHMKDSYDPQNHVYSCVPETLQALKQAGFTLGMVSNRSNPCQEECQQLGLLGYFDFVYVAAEVGAWKPDPRIFDRALELSSSLPERVVYVGDNYYADIIGARAAGLQPVLLDPRGLFPEASDLKIHTIREFGDLLLGDR
jgi:HAD superfamily hydrolase (TIGR01549 family)